MMDNQKYSIFVETLRKMYAHNCVSVKQLNELLDNESITLEEYNYALGKGDTNVHNID